MFENENKGIIELEAKLLKRNANILELEEQCKEYELINKHHTDLIGRQEEQIKNIKYLDRAEVEKILTDYHWGTTTYDGGKTHSTWCSIHVTHSLIDAICSLAINKLDKDRIIEVLNKYADKIYVSSDILPRIEQPVVFEYDFEDIAIEIIEGK